MLIISTVSYAALKFDAQQFTPANWSKQLDSINAAIATETWSAEKVKTTIETVTATREQANQCIKTAEGEISKLDTISSGTPGHKAIAKQHPQGNIANLDKERNALVDLRSGCHLYVLHADDILSKLETLHQKLLTEKILYHYPVIWSNIIHFPSTSTIISKIDVSRLNEKLINPFLVPGSCYIIILAALIGLGIGLTLKYYLQRLANHFQQHDITFNLLIVSASSIIPLMILVMLTTVFMAFDYEGINTAFLTSASVAMLAYLASCKIISALYNPPLPAKPIIEIPNPVPTLLSRRLYYLFTLIVIFYVARELMQDQALPAEVLQLSGNLFVALLSISLISIVTVINKLPKISSEHGVIKILINVFFTGLLSIILIADWAGFHIFAIFLVKNIAFSLAFIFAAWMLHIAAFKAISLIEGQDYAWQPKFRYYLGLRYDSSLYELIILKTLAVFVIWGGLIASLMKIWILSQAYFDKLVLAVTDGFMIIGLSINPTHIMVAMFSFVILSFINRIIKAKVEHKSRFNVDGGQVAIASVVGYIGFTIALIIALIIGGFNFTGLAIIAGALSVGIGFGLQNIVNNFISGLVLLIEAPIKPGDRILVGDIEGYVRHIHLRATEITTLNRANIFIPNSELISKNVTNFMVRNRKSGLSSIISVAYDSDLENVKEILLAIASNHPGISKDKADQPKVFCKTLGENAIIFELFCVLTDVDNKSAIQSDLNTAIIREFAKHNISIPFPQQDVHIRDYTKV